MRQSPVEPGFFQPNDYRSKRDDRPFTVFVPHPFFMQDTEVTCQDYRQFLESSDHPPGEGLERAKRDVPARLSCTCGS